MSQRDSAETVSDFLDLVLSGQGAEAIERYVATDLVLENPLPPAIPFGGRFEGPAGAARYLESLGATIEIEVFDVVDVIAEGDRVATAGVETSLVKETGRRYTMHWAHVLRVRDGQLVEWREYNDSAAMLPAFLP